MKMGTSLSHLSPSNIADATSDLAPETFMKADGAKVGIDFEEFFMVIMGTVRFLTGEGCSRPI